MMILGGKISAVGAKAKNPRRLSWAGKIHDLLVINDLANANISLEVSAGIAFQVGIEGNPAVALRMSFPLLQDP